MPACEFPKEVWERVIDWVPYYSGDRGYRKYSRPSRRTLSACALVRRAWLHRCQYHLFHLVELSNGQRAQAFLDVVTQTPSIRQYVGILIIFPSLGSSEKASKTPCFYNWIYTVLNILPPFLTKLYKLEFQNLPVLQPVFIALASRFEAVHTLSLEGLEKQSFSEIIRLVNRFPKLQRLDLDQCQWTQPAHCYTGRQCGLQRLVIETDDICRENVPRWMSSSRSASVLQYLWIYHPVDTTSMVDLYRILEQCPSTLKNLRLTFQNDRSLRKYSITYSRIHVVILFL